MYLYRPRQTYPTYLGYQPYHFTHVLFQELTTIGEYQISSMFIKDNRVFQQYNFGRSFFLPPQRSWGKVIFSQASVILLTGGTLPPGGGGVLPRGWGVDASSQGGASSRGGVGCFLGGCVVETPDRDDHCCGRYASYWNAFLLVLQSCRVWLIHTKSNVPFNDVFEPKRDAGQALKKNCS